MEFRRVLFRSQWLKLAERGRWLRHSPGLVRYVLQGLHQESFFFTLPFFLATTTWASAQPVFLVALAGFALVSMIDPLYFDRVVIHRGLLWRFHAAAGFATVLAAAPMLWQLTTATSLWLAIAQARPSIVYGKSVSLRLDFGGQPSIKKKTQIKHRHT